MRLQATLDTGDSALSNDQQALLDGGVLCAHDGGEQIINRLSDKRIGSFVHTLLRVRSEPHIDNEHEAIKP